MYSTGQFNVLVIDLIINLDQNIKHLHNNTLLLLLMLLLTFVVDLMIHIRAYPPERVVPRLGMAFHSAIEPRRTNVRR